MTGKHSVLRYWSDTTNGYLDFTGSAMLPWVDVTIATTSGRAEQAEAAIAAVRKRFAPHDPLAGFDGVAILAHPGSGLNAGATTAARLPVALLSTDGADHTFMSHEVGHVLGFDHTYGLDNNGADWDATDGVDVVDPVYGSPYDLMSSASFGSRWLGTGPRYDANPTFVGPNVAGWPSPAAFRMGPHLSRANLHHWLPDALAGRVIEKQFPTAGRPVRVRIVPASSASSAASLLILHPHDESPNGVGRVYIEYRTVSGWDAGLDVLGPSLSRVGVAVHSLVDVVGVGPRVWYRGCVPTSSVDFDVTVDSTPLVVSIGEIDPAGNWIEVAVAAGASRTARIATEVTETIVGEIGAVTTEKTPCGDTYRTGTFATSTVGRYTIRATGFGGPGEPHTSAPTVGWSVGGVALHGTSGTVQVPHDGEMFGVQYTIDPAVYELALTSRGGERLATPVVATVTGDGTTATATAAFDADGWYEGTHPDDFHVIARCLAEQAKVLPIDPREFRRPTPEPQWGRAQRRAVEQQWADRVLKVLAGTHIDSTQIDVAARQSLEHMVRRQVRDPGS